MQVSVHEVVHQVHVLERFSTAAQWRHHIYQVHDVVVLKLTKQSDFPQSTSGINVVVERILDLFNGDLFLVVVVVLCGTNNAICALPDGFDGLQT